MQGVTRRHEERKSIVVTMPKQKVGVVKAAELRRRFTLMNMREAGDLQNDNVTELVEPE